MTEVSDREVLSRTYARQLDHLASERHKAVQELADAEREFATAQLRLRRAHSQLANIDGRMDMLRELMRTEGL